MGSAKRQWTVLALIDWTKGFLARAGVDQPRLSAEVLLARTLGCERLELYTRHDRTVTREHLVLYRDLVRRAAAGEPIAYLTGRKEFYSLSLVITPDVLIPRPETELLVDAALEAARAGARRLWDACTGSGCVAVAAARHAGELSVLATDISAPALAVAAENVARHGLTDRVRVEKADLLELPPTATDLAPVDVITANPPYVRDADMAALPGTVQCEPDVALRAGATGLEYVRRIIADAPARLHPGGLLAMEIGLGQADAVYELLNAAGTYRDIRFLKDQAGIDRAVLARRQ